MFLKKINSNIFSFFILIFLVFPSISLAQFYRIPSINESLISIGSSYHKEIDPNSIKVLVWNMLKSKRKKWTKDFVNLTKDKDLLILQEVYLNRYYLYVYRNIVPYRFDMAISFLYQNNFPTGNMIGSKIEPTVSSMFRTSKLEPIVGTPKTAVYSIFPIKNYSKDLLVISIHGLNMTKNIHLKNQIREIFEVVHLHDGPVIFGGDFNTWNKKRTNFLKKIMTENNFKEVFFKKDKRLKVAGYPLDYVFLKDIEVKDSRVLNKIKSSDHKPIILELFIK
jgi:endonuclease/exonuclease/phosphatase (EEP) superfamily protein YafD